MHGTDMKIDVGLLRWDEEQQ